MIRRLLCVIVIAACSKSSPPAPGDNARSAPVAGVPTTTTCYRETDKPELALRITLDPTHRTIELATLASGAQSSPTEMFSVHGDKLDQLTKVTTHDAVRADGKLDGPAWQWTAWTIKRVDARSGDTTTTTFAMTAGGLTSRSDLHPSSGDDQHGESLEFQVVACREVAPSGAPAASPHFRPTEIRSAGPTDGR